MSQVPLTQFGEIITNDMSVAKLAREMERQSPPKKRRGLRRVGSLIAKGSGRGGDGAEAGPGNA